MSPYSSAGWDNFFVAEAGASAALAGLIFVALSINLAQIMKLPTLPGRAAEGLVSLIAVLFASTLALVPGQAGMALGVELLILGGIVWMFALGVQLRAFREKAHQPSWVVLRVITGQAATLPTVVAGLSLLLGAGGGLYWIVVAFLGAFVQATLNAWVLMVEILR